MAIDQPLLYLGTAVHLAGVNGFYLRRVVQRCQRGEITLADAAQLLLKSATQAELTTEVVSVRPWVPDTLR